MENYINANLSKIILTTIIFASLLILRWIFKKAAISISMRRGINLQRTKLVVRYINPKNSFLS